MQTFETITEGLTGLSLYLVRNGGALPADVLATLAPLSAAPSPVDRFCRIAELIYANRAAVDVEARTIAAQLAEFASRNGWGVWPGDGRYAAISTALQRDPAEGDPEAMPDYAPAAAPAGAATAA